MGLPREAIGVVVGAIPEFLRTSIATCDFLGGVQGES